MTKLNLSKLTGKLVLITGAGSGLGRLLTCTLTQAGARLILIDIRKDLLDGTVALATSQHPSSQIVDQLVCDLGNREQTVQMAEEVIKKHKKLDILINNAGIVQGKPFLELSYDQMEKTMLVNAISHMWLAKVFLPGMIAENSGHIVTIASSAGWTGVPGLADYCASKSAAIGFHESIRLELKKQKKWGVKTTLVCPFYIATGMFEGVKSPFLGLPILNPHSVVNKIVRAICANEEVVTLPHFILWLSFVFKALLPSWISDWILKVFGISSVMDSFKGRGADWANKSLPKPAEEHPKSS